MAWLKVVLEAVCCRMPNFSVVFGRLVCKFESFNEEEASTELCVAFNRSAVCLLADGRSEVCQIETLKHEM